MAGRKASRDEDAVAGGMENGVVRLFRFDNHVGLGLAEYSGFHGALRGDTSGIRLSRVCRIGNGVHIGCFHFEPNSVLARHAAQDPQLFLVVSGRGWIAGDSGDRLRIEAGQGVFWRAGQEHESGSDRGMTAIIVESPGLDPAAFVPEI